MGFYGVEVLFSSRPKILKVAPKIVGVVNLQLLLWKINCRSNNGPKLNKLHKIRMKSEKQKWRAFVKESPVEPLAPVI